MRTNDGSIWHRDPNPQLPRYSSTAWAPTGNITIPADTRKQPVELFELFIPHRELAAISYYTDNKINTLKRKYKVQNDPTLSSLSIMELKALLGILILSGIKEDNHVGTDQMWSMVEGCPLYRSVMSNRRFNFLMRALRFDDSDTRNRRLVEDRLAPVRSVWDAFVQGCMTSYVPGPNLTVDEQLVPFRGRCRFLVYIANKPAK